LVMPRHGRPSLFFFFFFWPFQTNERTNEKDVRLTRPDGRR
jgi:hypothetical protein